MVRVPLPQEALRPASQGGGFSAPPSAVPLAAGGGRQIEQFGAALTQAGLGVARQATLLEEQLHVAAAKEAQALAEERIVTADLDYRSRIGKAATGTAREEAFEHLQEELRQIEGGLDETPRSLFRQVVDRRLTDVRARWGGHEIEQTRAYEIGASKAVLDAKKASARRQGPGEPETLEGMLVDVLGVPGPTPSSNGALLPDRSRATAAPPMLDAVRMEAQTLAQKLGYGPEQSAGFVLAQTTEVHAGIVEDLVEAGRGTEAREYLAAHDAEVTPDEANRLNGLLRRASVSEEGARLATELAEQIDRDQEQRQVQEATQGLEEPELLFDQVRPLSAQELLAEGRERVQAMWENGEITIEVRNAARGEIERMASEQRAVEVDAEDRVSREGEQWLIDHPLANVESMPESLYQRGRELGLLDDWNRFSGSGGRYSTDEDLFSRLYLPGGDGLFALPPKEFADTMRRKLDPQHFQAAMGLYASANKIQDPKLTKGAGFETRLREAARQNGFLPEGRTGSSQHRQQSAQLMAFTDAARRRLNQFENTIGRSATEDEQQSFIDDTLRDKVYLDVTGVDPLRILGTLNADEMTGLTDEQRLDIQRGRTVARRTGAYVDGELMTNAWRRNYPGSPVPLAVQQADQVYVSEIPEDVRAFIAQTLTREGTPVTQAAISARWILSGRPKGDGR